MKKVILEGAFYSPNASEGKWAWNIARLLDNMAAKGEIELDMFLPPGSENHIYYKQTECWHVFPHSTFVRQPVTKEYDVMFTFQPGEEDVPGRTNAYINKDIKIKKRVIGWFESYWFGNSIDGYTNLPENTDITYALQPYNQVFPHANWPKRKNKQYQLPYAPFLKPDACNFENKGILFTMKNPASKDYCDSTIEGRLDCFRLAIKYASEGLKVTVSCADRLFTENNKAEYIPVLEDLVKTLHTFPNVTWYNNIPAETMLRLISEHSVVFTGKVGECGIYSSFVDILNEGSVPVMWTDWPEQFFRDQSIFSEQYSYQAFQDKTHKLLNNKEYYQAELNKFRSNMILHTEEQGTKLLQEIINEN